MFRSALADFEDDPFFRDHHQRMSSMMRGFHDPFSHFGFPAALPGVENGGWAGRSNRGSQQLARPTDMFGSMFGDMFTNVNSMMANMHRNFEQMANNPNTYSYSSSSVMSYSSDGRGEPKYFQASKSTKRAPGGVKETQHSVRDSESGLHRMAIGHHLGNVVILPFLDNLASVIAVLVMFKKEKTFSVFLSSYRNMSGSLGEQEMLWEYEPTDDRSHVIERSLNRRSGEEERKQDFINLDESDAAAFDQEWKERTKQSSNTLRDRQRTTLRALEESRERPTHHSRHAGIAAPFRKDNGTIRDRDRLRVNGDGPGTHQEFDYKHRDHGPGQDRDRLGVIGEGPGAHREYDNRHRDHGAARDEDWGSGDFERAVRSHKPRQDRKKHVRVNSRPVNRHEPRGGL